VIAVRIGRLSEQAQPLDTVHTCLCTAHAPPRSKMSQEICDGLAPRMNLIDCSSYSNANGRLEKVMACEANRAVADRTVHWFAEQTRVLENDEPALAAHLVTARFGYKHHGIYVGAGRVIHYSGLARGWRSGPVEEISLADFARGRAVWVIQHANANAGLVAGEVVARARSRLGESDYRLLSNNCEHFCRWCVLGESRSVQIEFWQELPARARASVQSMLRAVPMWSETIM
jgi:Lecithin retinol acyltransferase